MAQLHNRISRKELKQLMLNDHTPRVTVSFYNYIHIEDPSAFRNQLYGLFREMGVLGRIYVAHEGMNAQVSIPEADFQLFKDKLYGLPGFEGVRLNRAFADGKSFFVLDIKVRKKIVADGIDDPAFDMSTKGKYVNAVQFNEMVNTPGTIVIDMRNHYEYEVGHFQNAVEVPSDTFREQLPMSVKMMEEHKEKNIIMYCTGGIRCEKASAWMLHKGFNNVFHLEGGIINYAREVKENNLENKFIGKNFVFDDRLGERITDDVIANCHQCGKPCDDHVNCQNDACHLLFIQCPGCREKFEGCCSSDCRDFIHLPADRQAELRRGIDKGRNIFNKAKARQNRQL